MADQAHVGVALHHLAQPLDAHVGVVLSSALQPCDLLGPAADPLPMPEDVVVGLLVPSVDPRGWEVHVEPLGPAAPWLAVGGGGLGGSHLLCTGMACASDGNRGCAGDGNRC